MQKIMLAMLSFIAFAVVLPAKAQSIGRSKGRHLAQTVCRACHDIAPHLPARNPMSGAPSFVAIAHMPSTNELAIKVFLRSSHRHMPNIVLSREEIDSVAAYILSLAKK